MGKCFSRENVLITGGAGFIGSHLADIMIRKGANVTVIDDLSAGSLSNISKVSDDITYMQGSVADIDFVSAVISKCVPSYVFHLAANASVPLSVDNPVMDFECNALATVRLLDSLRLHAPTARMVFASSGAVYGEPGSSPVSEDACLEPISPYGASKLAAETECRAYAKVYGLNVVIGRIFNTYGPRMPRFVLLDILRKLEANAEVLELLGSGAQVRDFNYVSDTVSALMCLAVNGRQGESYNLASGASCSVIELVDMVLKYLNLTTTTDVVYTGKSWIGDAQRWIVDISKVKRIGYSPEVPLLDGVKHVLHWYHGSSHDGIRKRCE